MLQMIIAFLLGVLIGFGALLVLFYKKFPTMMGQVFVGMGDMMSKAIDEAVKAKQKQNEQQTLDTVLPSNGNPPPPPPKP